MSFIGSIFKKKPGGTFVGNLLRSASSSIPVVGSAFGTGAGKIEVGQTMTNRELANQAYIQGVASAPPVTLPQRLIESIAPTFAASPAGQQVIKSTALQILKKYWWAFLIPVVLFAAYFMMKPKNKFSRNRYR